MKLKSRIMIHQLAPKDRDVPRGIMRRHYNIIIRWTKETRKYGRLSFTVVAKSAEEASQKAIEQVVEKVRYNRYRTWGIADIVDRDIKMSCNGVNHCEMLETKWKLTLEDIDRD